ncbi:hypothetical protein GGX14DRAFT_636517 [Mycena pura]|uniref:Uncharacterized protein n=1 Tax=Mycena pura TaxID=153505 RepID=A0AAD6YBC2_9AGAR|nr:hypothetical protein GGX14DRAFT_636517 [Mycena pura]
MLGEIGATPDAEARALFQVNFCQWGALEVSRETVRVFRDRNPSGSGGRLLNVGSSSGNGFVGMPLLHLFCKSHSSSAVEGFTESLRLEPGKLRFFIVKICVLHRIGMLAQARGAAKTCPELPHGAFSHGVLLSSEIKMSIPPQRLACGWKQVDITMVCENARDRYLSKIQGKPQDARLARAVDVDLVWTSGGINFFRPPSAAAVLQNFKALKVLSQAVGAYKHHVTYTEKAWTPRDNTCSTRRGLQDFEGNSTAARAPVPYSAFSLTKRDKHVKKGGSTFPTGVSPYGIRCFTHPDRQLHLRTVGLKPNTLDHMTVVSSGIMGFLQAQQTTFV